VINFLNKMVLVLSILVVGCEEELPPEIELPLSGTYTLTQIEINEVANTLSDTIVNFIAAQNGIISFSVDAGTKVLETSTVYSTQDSIPIGGTITLNNDESARLSGSLPIPNGCKPTLVLAGLGSDGVWSVDTSLGTFSINLVVDALDIDGSYTLVGDQLVVRYESVNGDDERLVSQISYLGVEAAVSPICLPVSTVTERIMSLTLD
jgi:hypothetical protein